MKTFGQLSQILVESYIDHNSAAQKGFEDLESKTLKSGFKTAQNHGTRPIAPGSTRTFISDKGRTDYSAKPTRTSGTGHYFAHKTVDNGKTTYVHVKLDHKQNLGDVTGIARTIERQNPHIANTTHGFHLAREIAGKFGGK